jgi:ribonuclease-3
LQGYDKLEAELGISFGDKDLLRQALVHSSYMNENPGVFPESNERLEFLGDAVIGVVVAAELFSGHPDWPEGELTHGRSILVRGEALARVADSVELGKYLNVGKGEERAGGRQRMNNMAATFEAVLGALFLDQGYQAARGLVVGLFADALETLGQPNVLRSPKSTLQEAVQAKGLPPPAYRIVGAEGEDHAPRFTAEVVVEGKVAGRGAGARKSLAEQEAAAEALSAMGL